MVKAKSNYIRLVFAVTGIVIAIFVIVAAFQRQSGPDMAGSWQLATVDGVKAPPNTGGVDEGFVLTENGTFDWPSFQISGTWKVEEANLVLHTDKYDGKTQAQFRADTQAKYPSDPSMQKIADKVFEQLKLSTSADGGTLSIDLGGNSQTYTKKLGK